MHNNAAIAQSNFHFPIAKKHIGLSDESVQDVDDWQIISGQFMLDPFSNAFIRFAQFNPAAPQFSELDLFWAIPNVSLFVRDLKVWGDSDPPMQLDVPDDPRASTRNAIDSNRFSVFRPLG